MTFNRPAVDRPALQSQDVGVWRVQDSTVPRWEHHFLHVRFRNRTLSNSHQCLLSKKKLVDSFKFFVHCPHTSPCPSSHTQCCIDQHDFHVGPCWFGAGLAEHLCLSPVQSASWFAVTCQLDVLSYWILTNVSSKSDRSNYFVYIKKKTIIRLFTSTCERNGSNKQSAAFIFLYI